MVSSMADDSASDNYHPVSPKLRGSLAERRDMIIGGVNIDHAGVEAHRPRATHNQAMEQIQTAQTQGRRDLAEQPRAARRTMNGIGRRGRKRRNEAAEEPKDLKKQLMDFRSQCKNLKLQNKRLQLQNELLQLQVEDLQHRVGIAEEQNGLLQRHHNNLPRQIDKDPDASNHHSDTTQRTLPMAAREADPAMHRRHAQVSDSGDGPDRFYGRALTINVKAKEEDI
ncbi:hypothetical protein Hte_010014 [Hypoxylon texense]